MSQKTISSFSSPRFHEGDKTEDCSHILVSPVLKRRDRDAFLRLPFRIFNGDPAWIPPILIERKGHCSRRNPFFSHAIGESWIAWRSGVPVGRISAHIDHLYLERYGDDTGFFGMIEAVDDPAVFHALFAHAEKWLLDHGMRKVLGPFNYSINQECGLLVEGFGIPPSIMMGHCPPYYPLRVEELGYSKAKDLLAYRIQANFPAPSFLSSLQARYADRIRMRTLDNRLFFKDLQIIRDIYNDAWSGNWGFVPFTEEEFRELGSAMRFLVPPDYVRIAEVDGEPAAMMVLFPNLNEAIRDLNGRLFPLGWLKLLWRLKVCGLQSGRVPLMGVRRRFQSSMLGAALSFMMITSIQASGLKRGIKEVEMSWILEDNPGMIKIIESIGGTCYKRYRIYEKVMAN